MLEIAEGVQYLHSNKIIHRNLKPENIFLGDEKVVKIGDLGMAKLIKASLATTVGGSPLYMAH